MKRRGRKSQNPVTKRAVLRDRARLQGQLQRLEAEKAAIEGRLREVEDELREVEDEKRRVEDEKREIEREKRALERENERLREENTRLRSENLKLTERLARTGGWDSEPGRGGDSGSKCRHPERTRPRKRGRPTGHAGSSRPAPVLIDEELRVSTCRCPFCAGLLPPPTEWREHTQEDVVLGRRVRRLRKGRSWCCTCQRYVTAMHPDELPNSPFGADTAALALFLRHEANMPEEKIRALFAAAGVEISRGGLNGFLARAAACLETDYQLIKEGARESAFLHIDETGARVDGRRGYLWAFTNDQLTYFEYNPSRSAKVPEDVLGADWEGIVICDFYAAYDKIGAARQRCIRHLIRDLTKLSAEKGNMREVRWFTKKVFRLIRDAARLKERGDGLSKAVYERRRGRLERRLDAIANRAYRDADCARLSKRLARYREEILLFLQHASIEWTNNRAEREIRPSVVLRKIIGGHRTERGARAHAIVRSVIQTAKRTTKHLLGTLKDAIRGGFTKIKERSVRANEDVVIEVVKTKA